MNRLQRLSLEFGQSPWLDNLKRGYLTSGELAALRDRGIRGLTSNPTIFQKAIQGSSDYDEQFSHPRRRLATRSSTTTGRSCSPTSTAPATCSHAVYDATDGLDGYASVEVAPDLAHDQAGTELAARDLHERLKRRNLMVKIPATAEGVPAIRQMISEGRNINVTLIFSLDRYQEVMEAYISGLEQFADDPAADLSRVASVASFFISRVDTEVDRRLEAIGTEACAGAARQGRPGPRPARLPPVPRGLQRPTLGSAGVPRRPRPAPAVGEHGHQEPRLLRRAVRRSA